MNSWDPCTQVWDLSESNRVLVVGGWWCYDFGIYSVVVCAGGVFTIGVCGISGGVCVVGVCDGVCGIVFGFVVVVVVVVVMMVIFHNYIGICTLKYDHWIKFINPINTLLNTSHLYNIIKYSYTSVIYIK